MSQEADPSVECGCKAMVLKRKNSVFTLLKTFAKLSGALYAELTGGFDDNSSEKEETVLTS